MKNWIVIAAIFLAVWLGITVQNAALACTKLAGCVMDVFHDDYKMKRDGRMEKAILAGRDNVAAFQALRAREAAIARR